MEGWRGSEGMSGEWSGGREHVGGSEWWAGAHRREWVVGRFVGWSGGQEHGIAACGSSGDIGAHGIAAGGRGGRRWEAGTEATPPGQVHAPSTCRL